MMWSSIAKLKENLHKITLNVHDDDGDEGFEIYNSPDRKGHLHTDRRFPYCFAHSSPASHSPMANGFDSSLAVVPIQVNKNLAFTDGMRVIESAKVSMHAVMFQAPQPALHRNRGV
ncbi:hypothetical protein RHGRI_035979 [Rhododendron griersonianum]|uniref:Uncharacterized protein n=1 Tax=Rhododendron griersonianum TaxID=479676 RepID=A0AAV6HQA0_9ERIC|nr:hypothetical protein RHGRI_035979 [Rhododendron griersonianum]